MKVFPFTGVLLCAVAIVVRKCTHNHSFSMTFIKSLSPYRWLKITESLHHLITPTQDTTAESNPGTLLLLTLETNRAGHTQELTLIATDTRKDQGMEDMDHQHHMEDMVDTEVMVVTATTNGNTTTTASPIMIVTFQFTDTT